MNTPTSSPLLYDIKGQGQPLVLVPGGITGWLSWIPFVEPLATNHQVIRVQLRSVELAEAGIPYGPEYGTLTEREALRAAVDEIGLDAFDLVAWCYGAHCSLAFALEYPTRIRSLTLIEPPSGWILRETGHRLDELGQIEAFDRSTLRKEISIDDLKAFLIRAGLGKPGDNFESLPSWPVWVRNRQIVGMNGTHWDYTDSLDRLRSLNAPVLGVRGTETTAHLAQIVSDLLANVPHGRLLELPGDHACHIKNMDRFLAELKSHLAQHAPVGAEQ